MLSSAIYCALSGVYGCQDGCRGSFPLPSTLPPPPPPPHPLPLPQEDDWEFVGQVVREAEAEAGGVAEVCAAEVAACAAEVCLVQPQPTWMLMC